MDAVKHVLSNGLRLLYTPMSSSPSVTVTVWVGVGSRYEDDRVAGISHFLEHMVFKGSAKRPSALAISKAVDALGAEINAGTSKEWTNFYIKGRVGVLPEIFDILSDLVLNPVLEADEIEREKGVILEEIAMYEDTPRAKVVDVFDNVIFGKSDLGRDVIGSRETVKKLTKDDFLLYRNTHYYTDNIIVSVAGGVSEEETLKLCEKYFSGLPKSEKSSEYSKYLVELGAPKLHVVEKKTDQAHMVVGFLGNKYGSEARYAENVLAVILGGGMSSRLFTEVRERRGLCYSVQSSADNFLDTGYIATYVGASLDKLDEALKVILTEHYKLVSGEHGITEEEFRKAKEYLKGHLALSLEDSHDVNYFFGMEELMLGKVRSVESVMEKIDGVTLDNVLEVARSLFVKEKLSVAIIGPYPDKSVFEKVLE